jgi:hypothetical protein
MRPVTPYSADLGDREPVAAMRETAARMRDLTGQWSAEQFERTHAPGKWTARETLTHLAQCELMFGTRARMALSTPNYVSENMDQDAWMAKETRLSGLDALDAFCAASRMNASFFETLSATDRAAAFSHPEYGALTVDWVVHQTAGHQRHHLAHIETIAALR